MPLGPSESRTRYRVMLYIVMVGLLNLGLGFATAVVVTNGPKLPKLPSFSLPRMRFPRLRRTKPVAIATPVAPPVEELIPPALKFTIATPRQTDEIPTPWLEMLDETAQSNTFVEAAVHVLRLEVGKYRDHLIAVENALRKSTPETATDVLTAALSELRAANQDWLARQSDATEHLRSRHDGLGEMASVGHRLEAVLMDQQSQIETTANNLEHLDFLGDPATGAARLLRETARLIDLAHLLRDRMLDALGALAREEKRLGTLDAKLRHDATVDLPNRAGLEALFDEWWMADPSRQRVLSVAAIDVDRFARLNEQLGTLGADRLLAALGRTLNECLRRSRGFDRLGRLAGQQFLLMLGDTGPNEATSAIERLRQTVVATSFMLGTQEVALTLRAAVTDVREGDTTESLFARLQAGIHCAQTRGGNGTVLDEGRGFAPIDPPNYEVRGHFVNVSEPEE